MPVILVVDDEEDIRQILSYNLKKEGYHVIEASQGDEALYQINRKKPDLILLDVMMPGMDGIEVCEVLKSNPDNSSILICFLTSRSEDYSQIAGLDAGADDYITKPIKPKVLISRVNALLRRREDSVVEMKLTRGIEINREKYIVEKDGNKIRLPRKEFELLALLASRPDCVFKREIILEKVWGNDVIVGDRTIDVHIRKLRTKVGENHIKTVKGVGYKFISNQ
ncbi:MAG: response regulator transcription factor [Bacteroidetes bacterium]|nr:response regulator transcription factor [Bacteroidota bacterium]